MEFISNQSSPVNLIFLVLSTRLSTRLSLLRNSVSIHDLTSAHSTDSEQNGSSRASPAHCSLCSQHPRLFSSLSLLQSSVSHSATRLPLLPFFPRPSLPQTSIAGRLPRPMSEGSRQCFRLNNGCRLRVSYNTAASESAMPDPVRAAASQRRAARGAAPLRAGPHSGVSGGTRAGRAAEQKAARAGPERRRTSAAARGKVCVGGELRSSLLGLAGLAGRLLGLLCAAAAAAAAAAALASAPGLAAGFPGGLAAGRGGGLALLGLRTRAGPRESTSWCAWLWRRGLQRDHRRIQRDHRR